MMLCLRHSPKAPKANQFCSTMHLFLFLILSPPFSVCPPINKLLYPPISYTHPPFLPPFDLREEMALIPLDSCVCPLLKDNTDYTQQQQRTEALTTTTATFWSCRFHALASFLSPGSVGVQNR